MHLTEEEKHFCFIRQPEVTRITSIPKSSIPIYIKEEGFPKPVKSSGRTRVWLLREVYAWMQMKLDERDKKQDKCNIH